MSRKTILFLIIVFFLIGLGFFVYYFFFSNLQNNDLELENQNQIEDPFGNFFPIENTSQNNTLENSTETSQENINFQNQIPKLRKISNVPVAGATIFTREATTTNEIISDSESNETSEKKSKITEIVYRYIERATGHVFETTSHNLTSERISNTTIPKIYEAFFLENKDQFILRYLNENNDIETYFATIKQTNSEITSENKTFLDGVFLQKNISQITVSPDGKNLFLLTENPNPTIESKILGYTASSIKPLEQKKVFSSPLSEWKAEWVVNNKIFLNTKPSSYSLDLLYELDLKTEHFDKIIGPYNGLVSRVSPDNQKIIFSTSNGNGIETKIIHLKDSILKNFKVNTLAEKCVWNSKSTIIYCAVPKEILRSVYPDYWYLGLLSFNDSLMKMDIENEKLETIMSANSETSENLDITNLQISPDEDYLLFTNKIDLSLWSLDLK